MQVYWIIGYSVVFRLLQWLGQWLRRPMAMRWMSLGRMKPVSLVLWMIVIHLDVSWVRERAVERKRERAPSIPTPNTRILSSRRPSTGETNKTNTVCQFLQECLTLIVSESTKYTGFAACTTANIFLYILFPLYICSIGFDRSWALCSRLCCISAPLIG